MFSKLEKIFYKIKWWVRHDAKYTHKYILTGVKNLWRWFPLIWNDRDWDDYYIWVLLEKKLTNQANYIGGRGIHLNAHRDAERMRTCVKLMERIRGEYYSGEYVDYHKSEFHWDDIEDKPDYKQLRIEEISENFDDYFKKYPRIHKQVLEMDTTLFNRSDKYGVAINIAHINHRRARKLLFKMLDAHIESWWD
jgi:hypothetical protein